jgi:undecaprenyl-diphosphatase
VLDLVQVPHATWLDLVGSVASIFGQAEVTGVVALAVAIVWWRARRERWWLPLLIGLVVAIEVVLKIVIPQLPPPHELSRTVHLLPFIESPTAYAFPSGHVARVAFLVTAFSWPLPIAIACVLLMALTRVYLGEHWPSDVIGGWVLGYAVARLAGARAA